MYFRGLFNKTNVKLENTEMNFRNINLKNLIFNNSK